ncbi:MAG: hypothetical protein ACLFTQ_02280 [Candidatus Aenigmatarchaeota archaeon]
MAEEEKESAITFETFRKFQRKEKKNEKLQELPEDFFKRCVDWINRKQQKFDEEGDSTLLRELENVKSIVSDIFERRRKKILILALHSVRSKKVSENLLPEEEEFFEKTVENLRSLEENLLEKVLEGKKPEKGGREKESKERRKEEKESKEKKEEGKTEEDEDSKAGDEEEDEPEMNKGNVKTRSLGENEEVQVETSDEEKLVQIIEEVDRFLGTDGEEYGPLEEGDIVTLPKKVADLLIEKDRAEASEI